MERRLTCILAADVVGYSRLMAEDEAGTLVALKRIREELLAPKSSQYGGRTIKLIGDGDLMEFASVVDAVAFAVEVQCALRDWNAGLPEEQRLEYRIGVNIGDVIVDQDDIYGDGVNIAARIEALANPGGICLAQNVVEQIKQKLDLTVDYLGDREVKNIPEPVPIYRVELDDKAAALVTPVVRTTASASLTKSSSAISFALALLAVIGGAIWWYSQNSRIEPVATVSEPKVIKPEDRHAIAVLPFINIGGEKQQEYFTDGMTQDLITDLSKIRSLSVISRTSTAGYKGKKIDIRTIGEALNVRYVIEGSVRRRGETVRINAQLTDATTGSHIWAERYDGRLNDIFSLQDKVLAKVIGSLALELSEEERRRVAAKGTRSVAAHDLYLRGLFEESRFTREGNREARRLYDQALSIDPKYALPYTRIANILELETRNGWSNNVHDDLELAVEMTEKAARLDPKNPKIYWSLGRAIARQQKPDALKRGIAAMRRAIDLDPYFADAYAYLTVLYTGEGRADDGLRSIETAMRMNPHYPFWYLFMRGMARFCTQDYKAAVTDLEAAAQRSPTTLFLSWWLAATYVQLGRIDDAEWQVEELKSMGFNGTISTIITTQPIKHPPYLKIYRAALRKAGIPE